MLTSLQLRPFVRFALRPKSEAIALRGALDFRRAICLRQAKCSDC